jgi:hypothetical protein
MDDSPFVDSEGYRFRAPFFCLCCEKPVSVDQFRASTFCRHCQQMKCVRGSWHKEISHGYTYYADEVEEGHGRQRELTRKFGSELTKAPMA